MTTENNLNSEEVKTIFEIGEIVRARDRLWRIDRINRIEKEIKKEKKEFIVYTVSNITGQPSNQLLIPEIEKIEKSILPRPKSDVIGSPIYQRLLLDAMKLDLIYGTSSFISLQNSKVIPISYQMVPVLMALNLKNVRLLLADDVGLGKTIEAGLILQELIGRKRINRVLIVVPANLREQWQTILRRFFSIDTVIMSRRNRRMLESELLVGGNPWGYYNFIIVSIDYAKQFEVKEEILQFEWDMVIIDEAHNVMRPHSGSNEETTKNFKQSYGFAKILAEKYSNLLLLTATPHNGYKDCFSSLLEMISPELVSLEDGNEYKIHRDIAINHICQRRREDVEDWIKDSKYNKNPFPKRDSDEIYITPSQQFKDTIEILNDFSQHVLQRSDKTLSEEKKLNIWTILHFHKRAISSPNALLCSVNNRMNEIDKKLQKNYQAIQEVKSLLSSQEAAQSVMDGYETDRLSEYEIDNRNDKLILTKTLEDLQIEKKLLQNVKITAGKLKENDTKLIDLLDKILPECFKYSKKIIIFTRYIDTLTYIKENLLEKKQNTLKFKEFEILTVHGRMPSQRRQDNYNKFLESEQGILISTDCMAEGIDLQFSANQVINYELTWNPNRLEQRNGRIDRFGQPEENIYIRTLIMKDTIEMNILEALVKKADEIKKAYGFIPGFFGDPEKIIDHIREKRMKKKEIDLQTTLDKWLTFSKSLDDVLSVFFSEHKIKEMVEDSFYGHNNINLQEIEERMKLTEENIGNEKTLLSFVRKAVDLYGGKVKLKQKQMEIYEITLPDHIQKDIGVKFDEGYLITPNREINAQHHNIEGVHLKNPIVSGLIEKIKNEAFSIDNEFYGRTTAFSSVKVSKISTIINIKIRYIINTEPKTLMEEIIHFGIDLFDGSLLQEENINAIWSSEWKNHNKKDIELKKHLRKTLELSNLNELISTVVNKRLVFLIDERKKMIKNLNEQGITTDLRGLDDVNVKGTDLVTITLVYPIIGGN
ncbi:MAG: DEAD/DEAH box helicase [Candidatus Lokiarchaeota archaeon]|nr:DEAD/DEAH box helicase [Candidatus Lokiarchaeota archaeon]